MRINKKDKKRRQQIRAAVINDVTGFGRCSAAVAQPILSAMKIQCCVLPTAVLSAHTAFPGFFFDDFTDKMLPYMEHWRKLNIEFDGIYTGYLGSKKQISHVLHFIEVFKKQDTIVLVDPVMGDDGKPYEMIDETFCREMRKLVKKADIITPNLTESCILLGIPYLDNHLEPNHLFKIAEQLSDMGPDKVIITGLKRRNQIVNAVYDRADGYSEVPVKKAGRVRCGTGDVFASVLLGALLNGAKLKISVKKAARYIRKSLLYTEKLNQPAEEGVCFERFLTKLK